MRFQNTALKDIAGYYWAPPALGLIRTLPAPQVPWTGIHPPTLAWWSRSLQVKLKLQEKAADEEFRREDARTDSAVSDPFRKLLGVQLGTPTEEVVVKGQSTVYERHDGTIEILTAVLPDQSLVVVTDGPDKEGEGTIRVYGPATERKSETGPPLYTYTAAASLNHEGPS